MADEIITPRRDQMATRDGVQLSFRTQKFLEAIGAAANAPIDFDVVSEDLINSLILEALGLHSDPMTVLALGQIKNLIDEVDSMDQQIAALQADVGQLRAQAMNQDATLEAIQDTDDISPLRAKIAINAASIRQVYEWAGAASSGAWSP